MREVLLLGASGSIGTQTLDVLEKDEDLFRLIGFSVGHQVQKIEGILKRFPSVSFVCVQEESDRVALSSRFPEVKWYSGQEGLQQIILDCPAMMVVNALVGFAGLVPSLTALRENRILCLANKESLVVGGELIRGLLAKGKGKIYPIDSEHVAIAKLLSCEKREDVDKILITASGGSFRSKSRQELVNVTPEMALNHPTWKMGAKITIDSATMMNKGFEVLEAKWLFDFPLEKTEILMHDESRVHSLLLLKDGSYSADVSEPDMKGPIEYALKEGNVPFTPVRVRKLSELVPYHFHKFDPHRYPAPGIALGAYKAGGTATAVLNAANEEAVYAFLNGKIAFLEIEAFVKAALEAIPVDPHPSLRQIMAADSYARMFVKKKIERRTA